jgi:cellulose synthase/poly-beta-1,6-N-acetylglucosamine synthase-like glycosyltransferase
VAERVSGEGGKGAAISWYLDGHDLAPDETLIVVDADNRLPSHALARIADRMDQGARVIQCYLDAAATQATPIAEASALSYWAGNRMVQLARENLGWSADLGGTGMAMTSAALTDAGGFGDTLTEDQDLGIRLLLAGHRVSWLHEVRVVDEKPVTVPVAMRQRARWMAGKRAARRRHLASLLRRPSPARVDAAIRLVQPGRSFIALVSGILTVGALATTSSWLLPGWVWASATALQVLQPIPYLAKEGVEPARIARYPLLALLAALWLPIRLLSSRVDGWFHTPHEGVNGGPEPPTAP